MPGDAKPWDPDDWENHIQNVLKVRYAQPVGCYQHIPADIKGDCGLEGFAIDGTAYQCYACQNWTDFGVLLEHQKNKMTADIGKLLKKETELLKILGDIRIGIWNFVLPFWNDKICSNWRSGSATRRMSQETSGSRSSRARNFLSRPRRSQNKISTSSM